MASEIYTAPPGTGTEAKPVTLPSLMYRAHAQYANPKAYMQPQGTSWKAYSTDEFRSQSENAALGLLDLELERGDKVALFLDSDVHFAVADMACLIAGLVDVPIYLTHKESQIEYVLKHCEAKAVIVADNKRLEKLASSFSKASNIRHVILAQGNKEDAPSNIPDDVYIHTMDEVQSRAESAEDDSSASAKELADKTQVDDLATIIYTSGTTGQPKGVMLTHGNISYNGMTAFNGLKDYVPGADGETVLSFLPLTHIFARALHYGYMAYGSTVYFSDTDTLADDLRSIRPTLFATVPRLLEKVYGKIQQKTSNMTGAKKTLGEWALGLAKEYEVGKPNSFAYKAQLSLADALVFKKWREALGGRVKYIVSGGAALNKDIANIFAAAGVTILEGYGLTETSPVIAFNRPGRNRPGTVGEPLAGTEVKIADDGEILSRGPGTMQGYFKDEEKTREVLEDDGWFHTGDIGEFSSDGYLKITDRKKDLFKLSTGKYVTPSPLENRLSAESLVEQCVVVGSGQKFCAALIFPTDESLRSFAEKEGLDTDQSLDQLVKEKQVIQKYQELVDRANEDVESWSTIKRFTLIPDEVSPQSGLLTPTMKIRRPIVRERYGDRIKEMYERTEREKRGSQDLSAV